MSGVGFTTDGEFNSLRTMGFARPISVVELTKSARNEARSMHVKTITLKFTFNQYGM